MRLNTTTFAERSELVQTRTKLSELLRRMKQKELRGQAKADMQAIEGACAILEVLTLGPAFRKDAEFADRLRMVWKVEWYKLERREQVLVQSVPFDPDAGGDMTVFAKMFAERVYKIAKSKSGLTDEELTDEEIDQIIKVKGI